jgi:hypothetical protein
MSRLKKKGNMVDRTFFSPQQSFGKTRGGRLFRDRFALSALVLALVLFGLTGCESEDCVNCVQSIPPVVPTGVHSISGDNFVTVQWYDISYHPYDRRYNANVVKYIIYSRFYDPGDENDLDRQFVPIGEVAWDENYDFTSGLHWFDDLEAENGYEYEYAVAAVNSVGEESALSYELVTDAPLPMGLSGVRLFGLGTDAARSGFDFSALDAGRTDPTPLDTEADIAVVFDGIHPYVQTTYTYVHIQDFGVFLDNDDALIFDGVSWAPWLETDPSEEDGYSNTGRCELIRGHIYVLAIDHPVDGLHYAKFGVIGMNSNSVDIVWAYQTIEGLPELKAPDEPEMPKNPEAKPVTISF